MLQYCAMGLGLVGLDFHGLLPPIFEKELVFKLYNFVSDPKCDTIDAVIGIWQCSSKFILKE